MFGIEAALPNFKLMSLVLSERSLDRSSPKDSDSDDDEDDDDDDDDDEDTEIDMDDVDQTSPSRMMLERTKALYDVNGDALDVQQKNHVHNNNNSSSNNNNNSKKKKKKKKKKKRYCIISH